MPQIMQLKVLRTDVGLAFRPVFRTNNFCCVAMFVDACCRLFSTNSQQAPEWITYVMKDDYSALLRNEIHFV